MDTYHLMEQFSKEIAILSDGWIAVGLDQTNIHLSINQKVKTKDFKRLIFNLCFMSS